MPYQEREPSASSGGAAALLLGVALGAAALLLSTPQGKKLRDEFSERAEEWKAQAAATLAQSREKVVSSVETVSPSEQDGRLRENL